MKRQVKCPHQIPIKDCEEHWIIFDQMTNLTTQLTNPTNEQELRDSDTAYVIAMTCYHAGSMAQRGNTIHPGTVREWTDRITAHTNAEIAKVLDRLQEEQRAWMHEHAELKLGYATYLLSNIEAERNKLKEEK